MTANRLPLIAFAFMSVACSHNSRGVLAAQQNFNFITSTFSKETISKFKEAEAEEGQQLIGNENVEGACIAITPTGSLQFDIYLNESDKEYTPPPLNGLPKNIIRVRGPFVPFGAKMGTSTSCEVLGVGTLGIAVFDNTNHALTGYITCNHVAAGLGCADGTDKLEVAPATCDSPNCMSPNPPIGKVIRSIPVSAASPTNDVDAAFVGGNGVDAENFCGLCSATGTIVKPADVLGNPVRKCGRTTGLTCGVVTGIGCRIKMRYRNCGMITLTNQIRIENPGLVFSHGGDSGAVTYTPDGNLVGLLCGGDTTGKTSFITPMKTVLDALDVSILPLSSCGTQPACLDQATPPNAGCPCLAPPPLIQ